MRKREVNPRKRLARRVAGIAFLLLLLVGAYKGFTLLRALAPKGSLLDPLLAFTNPKGQFPNRDRILILIAGKDYNRDRNGIAYTKDSRSDTIMLLSADLNTAKLTAVAIPRDTRVTAPDGVTGKINGTFVRGGVKLLEDTISQQFGVMPDYYVVLKADAVKEIVDAVGGVDVEAIDDMFYEDSWAGLKINIPKGLHHLNGDGAVGFVRFRKMGTHRIGTQGEKIPVRYTSSLEEGDLRRTERQQQLVKALTKQALSPQNLWNAPKILDIGFSQIETNLSRQQVTALASIFRKAGSADLNGTNIPGKDATIGGTYYWEPDLNRSRLTIRWLLLGDEAAGRQLVRVVVYNGTDQNGAARTLAAQLSSLGFTATSGGNLKDKLPQTEILFRKAAFEGYARQIAQQLGASNVRKDTQADPRADWLPEVVVRIGPDAKIASLPSPASAGPTVARSGTGTP